MNYIKHLNAVFEQITKDDSLNTSHVSLYLALFQLWNYNRFPEVFYINREQVMKMSKIGSKTTYHRCIKELDYRKYIKYFPSHNPFKGSKIKMFIFGTSSGQAVYRYRSNTGQALVPYININKHVNINKLGQPKNKKEVINFFKSQNWPEIEAEKFFNHYQGIGWKVGGKTKIVDWQATAHNWMIKAEEIMSSRQPDFGGSKSRGSKTKKPPVQNWDNLHTNNDKNYDEPL